MSEKSKGDTSRIFKNPLLSASVTGLTYEDFPNKPLLLPAAPPIVPEEYATICEDQKKSFTVGRTPEIDTDTLSEINLNTIADDEDSHVTDQQSNQSDIQDGSILLQAASSFSQLPSVASTVFSTFSKVIKEYTPSGTTRESSAEKELNQQTEHITDKSSLYIVPQFPDRNDNYYQPELILPETPKLYSPSDVTLTTHPISQPPLPLNQNTYRISAKKKTYAQIPGLSVPAQHLEQQQQFFNLSDVNKNIACPYPSNDTSNINLPSAPEENTPYNTGEYKSDERKALSLLSSLSINLSIQSTADFIEVSETELTYLKNDYFPQEPLKPPAGPIDGKTFRLQKGTRLYRSSFNPTIPIGFTSTVSPFVPTIPNSGILDCYSLQQPSLGAPSETNKISDHSPIENGFPYKLNSENVPISGIPLPSNREISNTINSRKNALSGLVESSPLFSSNSIVKGIENNIKITPLDTDVCTETQINRQNLLSPQSDNSFGKQDAFSVQSFFNTQPDTLYIKNKSTLGPFVEKQGDAHLLQSKEISELESVGYRISSQTSVEKPKTFYPIDEQLLNTHSVPSVLQESTQHTKLSNQPDHPKKVTTPPASFSISTYFNQSSESQLQQPTDVPASSHGSLLNLDAQATIVTEINPTQRDIENPFTVENKLLEKSNENTSSSISDITLGVIDSIAFFDTFHPSSFQTELKINENTPDDANSVKLQKFFNYPPQNINDSGDDLNYKLVGSGITGKQLENLSTPVSDSRALSPISIIVEPPSSTCSEFSSEFTTKVVGNISRLKKEDLPGEFLDKFEMAQLLEGTGALPEPYRSVSCHWFYKKHVDSKQIWTPFSFIDSKCLEEKYMSQDGKDTEQVEGGRYDVNISERIRTPAYWAGESTEVRRCSWFYKGVDSKYVPYEETIADLLEEQYREASESGEWHRKIALPTGETVVFHGPAVIVHFLQSQNSTDAWATSSQTPTRPRVVKRGIEDFRIEPGESERVDHLLFMVHGVGSACDLRFRPLEEVVEEFRCIANQLIHAHYKNSYTAGAVGRVEVLPVSWHSQLHSEESGIDGKLKAITLESIPKLRNFTNDTLLDILFYTSPVFCQNIMSTVADALNKMYIKYCQRNPGFKGGVSLAGHSLGSLILFDLLCHQKPSEDTEQPKPEIPNEIIKHQLNHHNSGNSSIPTSQQISYTIGPAGTGQPYINYPQLVFHPKKFFALGSPIGMFVTIRGIDALGLEFKFPTCTNFFHIFHPYDPVAYRIEALINPDLSTMHPVLIPHHKGRKRMHLELKETMSRVGADLKQRILDTFKTTLDRVNFLASKNKTETKEEIEKEVDKVLEVQLEFDKKTQRSRSNSTSTHSDVDTGEVDLPLGKLNDNRRIDYVLQEAPLEFFNEYLFAFASHVCYWDSEDTILFIMKEIYSSSGICTDSQVPQQSMTIERPNSEINSFSQS